MRRIIGMFAVLAVGCGTGSDSGGSPGFNSPTSDPALPRMLIGQVVIADAPTESAGVALFASPVGLSRMELRGTLPDGLCRLGRHDITLEGDAKAFASVGPEVRLNAGSERIPLPRTEAAAPGEPSVFYRFRGSEPLQVDSAGVEWKGDAAGALKEPFLGNNFITLPPAPTGLPTSITFKTTDPLDVRWVEGTAQMVLLHIEGRRSGSDVETWSCAARDTGRFTFPSEVMRDVRYWSELKMRIGRVSVDEQPWFTDDRHEYHVAGVGMRYAAEVPMEFRYW